MTNSTILDKVHYRKNVMNVLSISSPGFKYVSVIFTVSFLFPIVRLLCQTFFVSNEQLFSEVSGRTFVPV